jgi:hypothetical protein
MDFWMAFDSVEPIGESWRQTAETNSMLSNVIAYQAAGMGIKIDPGTIEDNMPSRYMRAKRPKEAKSIPSDPQAEFKRVAAAFGLTEIVKKHGRID